MEATRIDIADARPLAVRRHSMGIAAPSQNPAPGLSSTWSAIHDAAATVGSIAGIDDAELSYALDPGARVRFGRSGQALCHDVHDLAELMRCAIAALLAAHTSGGSPQTAARTLWAEFLTARDAIMRQIPQSAADLDA